MHDPMTVCFDIGRFITIWHVDPERDGSDDSCGWFMRSRHGDAKTLAKIEGRFAFEWTHGVPYGWFNEDGDPMFSCQAIALGMFRIAVNEVFGHWSGRADRFLRRHLHDILHFAENNCDSMYDMIHRPYGRDGDEKDRIHRAASCVYSWIIRADRPWWKHPKWHFWHWKIQVHPLQLFRRWLLTKCHVCGKGFKWGESPIGVWDSPKPRWFEAFRGERCLRHSGCNDGSMVPQGTKDVLV